MQHYGKITCNFLEKVLAKNTEKRQNLYEAAKAAHPERWSGQVRDWTLDDEVWLNPERVETTKIQKKQTS